MRPAGGEPHEGLISYHLHRQLATTERAWRMGGIHASDVVKEDFCPRHYALLDVLGKKPGPRLLATCDQVVFAQGRMHATMVIDWLARAGLAHGHWRCAACGREFKWRARPTGCVGGCRSKTFRYVEARVLSLDSGIDGGIDLFVRLPGRPRLVVVELKSCDKEKFKTLKMPYAEHRLRTSLYLRCLDESDFRWRDEVDVSEARVLYVSKGGWGEKTDVPTKTWGLRDRGWSPFKEFVVERDDSLTDEFASLARPLWRYRSAGGPMPSGVCPTALCDRAQRCEVRDKCFGGEYPAGSAP